MDFFSQPNLPIMWLLFGGGIPIPIVFGPLPYLGIVKPESLNLTRQARATLIQTEDGAFIDDFGEGPSHMQQHGHTGYSDGLPGIFKFKAIEALCVEFWNRRKRRADQGLDPNDVQLWVLDALNLEAYSVFPMNFSLDRTKQRPLLYFYRVQFTSVRDLLQDAVYQAIDSLLSGLSLAGVGDALSAIGDAFAGT